MKSKGNGGRGKLPKSVSLDGGGSKVFVEAQEAGEGGSVSVAIGL